jgi:hypothetical protein
MFGEGSHLRQLVAAHLSARYGAMDILDDVWLPKWLDRRLGWTTNRDRRRFLRAGRAAEKPPVGKDASQDW